jgi:hypothetical protein
VLRFFFQANPVKLVARLKRIQEEVAAVKGLCRDLLTQKQVTQNFESTTKCAGSALLFFFPATDAYSVRCVHRS